MKDDSILSQMCLHLNFLSYCCLPTRNAHIKTDLLPSFSWSSCTLSLFFVFVFLTIAFLPLYMHTVKLEMSCVCHHSAECEPHESYMVFNLLRATNTDWMFEARTEVEDVAQVCADVRQLPTVMNSFQSNHLMSSHTSWMELSHIIVVQKKGISDYCQKFIAGWSDSSVITIKTFKLVIDGLSLNTYLRKFIGLISTRANYLICVRFESCWGEWVLTQGFGNENMCHKSAEFNQAGVRLWFHLFLLHYCVKLCHVLFGFLPSFK